MTIVDAGRMQLQIVVPITGWRPTFTRYFWMVYLKPAPIIGLKKDSAADAFQIKSLSLNRFQEKLGEIDATELNDIAAAVALCIGYSPP